VVGYAGGHRGSVISSSEDERRYNATVTTIVYRCQEGPMMTYPSIIHSLSVHMTFNERMIHGWGMLMVIWGIVISSSEDEWRYNATVPTLVYRCQE
jgi:hypothetical protein